MIGRVFWPYLKCIPAQNKSLIELIALAPVETQEQQTTRVEYLNGWIVFVMNENSTKTVCMQPCFGVTPITWLVQRLRKRSRRDQSGIEAISSNVVSLLHATIEEENSIAGYGQPDSTFLWSEVS